MIVWATFAEWKAWLSAKPIVPPAMLAAMWGKAMLTIMKTIANAVYLSICHNRALFRTAERRIVGDWDSLAESSR